MRIIDPSYEIVAIMPENPLEHIERAGRTCYKSEDKISPGSAERFVRMILKRGHESVIEHASMTVRFICDRGVSHELVRHRLCAFSQESTRYCNYGKAGEVTFIQTPFWDSSDGGTGWCQYRRWAKSLREAEDIYLQLLQWGASPQQARSVLPNSLKTEIVVTANLREWRHIFRLRTAKAAHPQMRQVMQPLLRECRKRVPVLFEDVGELE